MFHIFPFPAYASEYMLPKSKCAENGRAVGSQRQRHYSCWESNSITQNQVGEMDRYVPVNVFSSTRSFMLSTKE